MASVAVPADEAAAAGEDAKASTPSTSRDLKKSNSRGPKAMALSMSNIFDARG